MKNANVIRRQMRKNIESCKDKFTGEVNHTLLAEMTACDLNLYIGEDCQIPEEVFEIAAEFD